MKKVSKFGFIAVALIAALMTGCGGGSMGTGTGTHGGGQPIDPSGNWVFTFTDSNHASLIVTGLMSQVGPTVSGNSLLALGNTSIGNCTSVSGFAFSNGNVANVSNFTGTIQANFGTLTFNSTLVPDGSSTSGTYTYTAGSCNIGIAASGTFTGQEVPSLGVAPTGTNWTGTISQNGAAVATLTWTGVIQNDSTGAVSGTYNITGSTVAGLNGSGNLAADPNVTPMLSGHSFQLDMGTLLTAGGPPSTAGIGISTPTIDGLISGGPCSTAAPCTFHLSHP